MCILLFAVQGLSVNGNWADWSLWSGCDVTCGNGKHMRTRTCMNPSPVYQRLDCKGKSIDTKPCVKPLCPVHGKWTEWTNWGACPVTCGIGIQKRHRSCPKPLPLRHGDHCFGDAIDVQICEQKTCNREPRYSRVAFHSYDIANRRHAITGAIVFSKVRANEGSSYNTSTGIFTAPRNGTYMFYAHLCSNSRHEVKFDIVIDGTVFASAYGSDRFKCTCDSTQAVAKLTVSSTAYIRWTVFTRTYWCLKTVNENVFSGYLIHQ